MNKELRLFYIGQFLLNNEIIEGLIPQGIGKKAYGFDSTDTPAKIVSTTFELATMLLYLRALRTKNAASATTLLDGFAEQISMRIQSMETVVNAALNHDLSAAKKTALLEIAVQLSEARLALKEGDYEHFMNVFDKGLQAAGVSPKQLDKDLVLIRQLAATMKFAFTTGMEDGLNRITAVTQI